DASMSFLARDRNWNDPGILKLLQDYVGRQAFLDDPTRLIWQLQEYRGDLRSLSSLILNACARIADSGALGTMNSSATAAYDLERLSRLLLVLYGQADSSDEGKLLRRACLDRWDGMLRHCKSLAAVAARTLDE